MSVHPPASASEGQATPDSLPNNNCAAAGLNQTDSVKRIAPSPDSRVNNSRYFPQQQLPMKLVNALIAEHQFYQKKCEEAMSSLNDELAALKTKYYCQVSQVL